MDDLVTLQSLPERLRAAGDAPALIAVREGEVETRSCSTVADEAKRLAAGLVDAGLRHGEPVGLFGEGSPDWIVAFLAIVAAGGIAAPIDTELKGRALSTVVGQAGCRRIFVSARKSADLRGCGIADDIRLYRLGGAGSGTEPPLPGWRELAAAAAKPLPPVAADATAALFHTSGTTGIPKGVPLTHANLVANINALVSERLVVEGDRVLLPLPPHHVYPLVVGALTPLAATVPIVFPAGISGPQMVDALHRGGATVLIGVPRLYSALLAAIDARVRRLGRGAQATIRVLERLLLHLPDRLRRPVGNVVFRRVRTALGPHLRLLGSGGAHLDEKTWRALEGFGWTVLTGYGLTETSPILTFNPLDRPKIGSAGKALKGVRLRIAAPGADDVGEIEARGPNVFAGYRDRPAETEAAFTADGWFRTGDLGRLDEDGYLHVVGRSKELIVLPDGKNVFPEDVEAVYGASPLIRELAVLEQDGALVGLIVPDLDELRKRGAESAVQMIRDEIKNHSPALPPYERLSDHAMIRTPLPRTAIGKLRRHQLAALYRDARKGTVQPADEMTEADLALLATSPAAEVWDWLKGKFPDRTLSLETSPQLDLGVDSLGWTGLSLEIQDRFGVSLAEEQVARIVTLRDLIREVDTAGATPAAPTAPVREDAAYLAPQTFAQRLCSAILYGCFRLSMRALFRLRIEGVENLPEAGPCIIAPNHASWLDPIAVTAALSLRQIRRTRFAGWTGIMFGNAASRAFSWAAGVFPVNPDRAPARSLALARAVLDQGCILVWFPEGRRTTDGQLQTFQRGIGALLEGSSVPVVPTYISGTFAAAPPGRMVPRITTIGIRFGAALSASDLAAASRGDTTSERIANALHDAVSRLRPSAASG